MWLSVGWLVASIVLAVIATMRGIDRDAAWIAIPSSAAVVLGLSLFWRWSAGTAS
jgi:hypothetical protein